jgi:hypothetical protein
VGRAPPPPEGVKKMEHVSEYVQNQSLLRIGVWGPFKGRDKLCILM